MQNLLSLNNMINAYGAISLQTNEKNNHDHDKSIISKSKFKKVQGKNLEMDLVTISQEAIQKLSLTKSLKKGA